MTSTKKIEEIMKESGWSRSERKNCGKIYVEYRKDGLVIDEDDISQEEK